LSFEAAEKGCSCFASAYYY